MNNKDEKLRDACVAALNCFEKLNNEKHSEIKSKLEYVIGSYNYDKNPVGLKEFGKKAAKTLKEVKAQSPRKVAKKVIEDLEKQI